MIARDSSAFWHVQDMADNLALLAQAGGRMTAVSPQAERPLWHMMGSTLPGDLLEKMGLEDTVIGFVI